jgi:hypothetical protein
MENNPLLRLHVAPTHDKKEVLRKRMQKASVSASPTEIADIRRI